MYTDDINNNYTNCGTNCRQKFAKKILICTPLGLNGLNGLRLLLKWLQIAPIPEDNTPSNPQPLRPRHLFGTRFPIFVSHLLPPKSYYRPRM